jgi:hypothetical protein
MNDNLPATPTPIDTLDSQSRNRWQRHIAALRITGEEQTSQLVRAALTRGDVDGALYEVYRARQEHAVPAEARGLATASITQVSESDEEIAAAISRLSADRATRDQGVNVRLLRESIFGRAEPLSRSEAWEFLGKAERLANPIPWERLHAGWDRSPLMSQSQVGEHATLSFRDDNGHDHQFRAGPSSVLGGLWVWATHLSTTYNWPRSQAAWFLLTGEPPKLLPATVLIERGIAGPLTSVVTVSTLAYGGDDSVSAALAAARRQLLGRRRGPLALARHAMAEFVDEQFGLGGPRPEWLEIWQRWNAFAPPQWRLHKRRLRYPNWRVMLDAYRREKAARGETEARAARIRERQARSRQAPRTRSRPSAGRLR